ncbi:hypothetical protein [Sphingobacterium siyangense]|uniref:hypothetical protein n=1 Tax=Sphingobacterium siyangense TaxID=459529 RepID=UPI002FDC8972
MRIHNNLNWSVLKALYDIFSKGKSSAKIQNDKYVHYLIYDTGILSVKLGSDKVLLSSYQFEDFFELNYLERYTVYISFLEGVGLEKDARQSYNEEDIKTLMLIHKNKVEIKGKLTTQKNFSKEFFRRQGSKYVENKQSLRRAILHILEVSEFPSEDQKVNNWRFVVDCKEPRAIILCENLNFLKMPWIAQKLQVKLWYVGGNNIKIIDQIDRSEFKYPIFYSGDWDYAGISIYLRIKKKLIAEDVHIALLYPNNTKDRLPVDSPHHYSKWDFSREFSGLDKSSLTEEAVILINELIYKNEWIEEEYNDLEIMMRGV